MVLKEIFAITASIIVSLGGGAALVFALSSWLGKVWANRLMEAEKSKYSKELEEIKSNFVKEAERYKVQLKKSEFLFQKQYEATSELVALIRSFSPGFNFPDMDWHDACENIAYSFEAIEKELNGFLAKHSAVLSEEINIKLYDALNVASKGKFENNRSAVSNEGVKMAENLFTLFSEAEKLSVYELKSQICT